MQTMIDADKLAELVKAAKGETPADTIIKNASVINIFSGEIYKTDVAILGELIAGMGNHFREAGEVHDVKGKYLAPGFIDAHIHIESTMLAPWEFAKVVLPRGTTAVVADPHEITNVLGASGFEFMTKAGENLPLDFFFMVPSCVPATRLETSGAEFSVAEIEKSLANTDAPGLAEMMNFPGVVNANPETLGKIAVAVRLGKPLNGHSPGLSGTALQAYTAVGIDTDHECVTLTEAKEKLRLGMKILIREGTFEKNLNELLPLINDNNWDRTGFVSDDKSPLELLRDGHMDHILRMAVRNGLSPARAIRLVTYNPVSFYNLGRRGAIAPGYLADLVVLDDLSGFRVEKVFKSGKLTAEKGKIIGELPARRDERVTSIMNIAPIKKERFQIPDRGKDVFIIEIVPDQLITRKSSARLEAREGALQADVQRDILKIAVVERHKGTGNVGLGWARGFGLKRGAMASSVAHDSHNIVAVGVDDESILTAARTIEEMRGGLAVVSGDDVIATLPLAIAGLMSEELAETVVEKLSKALNAAKEIGSGLDNPFFPLSFIALPVIPSLRLTDKGLVDVDAGRIVPLYADETK